MRRASFLLVLLLAHSASAQFARPIRGGGAAGAVDFVSVESPVAVSSGGSGTYATSVSALTISGSGSTGALTWACPTCTPTSGSASRAGSGFTISITAQTCTAGAGTLNTITLTRGTATATVLSTCTTPDAGSPAIDFGAGPGSTTATSVDLSTNCTDDVQCVSVEWARDDGVTGLCAFDVGSSGPTRRVTCSFALSTLSPCGANRVNTFTITATDGSAHTGTDPGGLSMTRTAALSIASASSIGSYSTGVARTGSALTATGGANCSYTWDTNGAGSISSLNTADAVCAGVALSAGGVPSGTATFAGVRPATCSWTARVTDGATSPTKAMTMTVVDPGAQTYFQQIAGLSPYAQAIHGCADATGGTVSGGDPIGCSLQNADEIHNLRQSASAAETYTYNATENAAKLTWAQADASPGSTIRFPINITGVGTKLLFSWDFKPTSSWAVSGTLGGSSCGGMVDPAIAKGYDHKEFQIAMSGGGGAGGGSITDEVKTSFTIGNPSTSYASTCADVGVFSTRWYPQGPNSDAAAGITGVNPVQTSNGTAGAGTQAAQTYLFKHSVWTRYWMEVRLNVPHTDFTSWNATYGVTVPAGTYHMVSLWVADETRNPVRLLYKAPMQRALSSHSGTATSITHVGTTATVTAASTLISKFGVGDTIYVSGAAQADYNGDHAIASVGTTTLTYTLATTPVSDATGTLTIADVRDGVAMVWFEHNTSNVHPKASGPATLSNSTAADITVAKNTVLTYATTGNTYKTAAAVTVPASGTASVTITAVNGGPGSNIASAGVALSTGVAGITVVTGTGGIAGGDYLLRGDLISYARYFHALKDYPLVDGVSAADDVTQNPTIFQKPR